MSGASYWGSGPGDPGRPVLKFTKLKPPAMQGSSTPCTLCKKPFYQFVHLQQHSRCHSGRRPFKCRKCNQSFSQLSHLMKHRLVKHEVKRKCDICGTTYSCWSMFLRHKIQTHGIKSLGLPKLKRTERKAEVEKLPKLSIKLCIKKSDITMTEDVKTENRKLKKRKKHKKHKKESKKLKQNKQNSPSRSDIKVQSSESKPRIILKFKMPKDNVEKPSDSLQAVNNEVCEESKVPAGSAAPSTTKTEAFTELVQSPSPKDSGIDDCSPLHETDHHENCSSNSAGAKSSYGNKQSKDIATPVTSAASSPSAPLSLSTSPTMSSSSLPTPISPRRPTRQDALLRHLMSAKDTPNSSAPSTPDNCKTAKPCVVRKTCSSHVIKREVCDSPRDTSRLSDIPATPSPHRSVDPDYSVPPSPVPSLKLTISKKPAGKLRGIKYTSSLHVPDLLPSVLSSESIASKSPQSTSASPRASKRQHSPFRANHNVPDPNEAARLIYSPDASMSSSRSPRQAGKSPKLCRMESSETMYSASHRSSLSPPHSLKSERDFGALNVDIDDDPYAFDDDPCSNSPHLLPYSSTLQRRVDKYKLDPPVLEPQILPVIYEPSDTKPKTRPKLTKQVDLRKQRVRKSSTRSSSSSSSKEVKPPRTPRSGRRGKTEEQMPVYIKQEMIEECSSPCDDPMPTLTRNVSSIMAEKDSVPSSKLAENVAKTVENKPEYCRVSESITSTSCAVSGKCGNVNKHDADPVLKQSCSSADDNKEQSSLSMPSLSRHAEATSENESGNGGKCATLTTTSSPEKTMVEAASATKTIVPKHLESKSECQRKASEEEPPVSVNALCGATNNTAKPDEAKTSVKPPAPAASNVAAVSVTTEVSALPQQNDVAMDDMAVTLNDSDLLLSDPQLENLSFNDSFLELGDDVVAPVAPGETLFDALHDSASTLHTLETASKASSLDMNKRKAESDPIVVTVPGIEGMEPISLVIDNEDSDQFGESDDDDFDLASLSSAPLAMASLSASHSSTRSVPRGPPVNATAAIVDIDSEFADLQSSGTSLNSQAANKPPITGFFNAFASFVSGKQPTDTRRASPGYCNEFTKFLNQKCASSEEEDGSEVSNGLSDGKDYTRDEIRALKHDHLRVQYLSEQIWRLLQTVFPFLELPMYMSGSSPCGVEALMDQVIGYINEQGSNDEQADSKPSVSLCAKPDQCLARLRTKVCDLLVVALPDLSLPSSFSQTGAEVDKLVEHVIASNVT